MSDDYYWLEYKSNSANEYDHYNYENILQSLVMNAGHAFMERALDDKMYFENVLEVGAGTGVHFSFVKHNYSTYVMTDCDKKALKLANQRHGSFSHGRIIRYEQQKAESLSYPDDSFDRVVAAHILEHLYEPHVVLKEWSRVIKNHGFLSVLIPSDPGLLWRMAQNLGPKRKSLKRGQPYEYLMAREHVNPCNNLVAILRYFFAEAAGNWWLLRIPLMDINFFYVMHAIIRK